MAKENIMTRNHGIIYDYEHSGSYGWADISAPGLPQYVPKADWRFLSGVGQHLGSALIVVGLAGLIFTFRPIVSSEVSYRFNSLINKPSQTQEINRITLDITKAYEKDQAKETARRLAQEWGVPNTKFSLYVPKIQARAAILENVNTDDYKTYMDALTYGVAHAKGSVLPGMKGGVYLFAHSTDSPLTVSQYNAVFYLLRELDPKNNDEIYVFFLDKLYRYRVTEKHIVDANDISWLANSQSGPERLILQTCWPPGTAWKRLIVVAEPVKTE